MITVRDNVKMREIANKYGFSKGDVEDVVKTYFLFVRKTMENDYKAKIFIKPIGTFNLSLRILKVFNSNKDKSND